MSSIYDIAGTTSDSFSLNGKCTLLQGSDVPSNYQGQDGDIYFRDNGYLYTKSGGQWNQVNATSLPSAKESENKFLYSNGETYQASERSIDEIVYVDELQNVDNNAIHKTGNEEINGVKTFNDEIYAPNQIDYSRITNCITEIPQDIKLELNNGTITLKAGSKVYVPNGAGKFNVVVIESDIVVGVSSRTDGSWMLFYRTDKMAYANIDVGNCVSGTTAPTTGTVMFYNTVNNTVRVVNNGSVSGVVWSLPLAKISKQNNVTSIDQVFNGFGYIGSTVFTLPGVKALLPNGRNADGTLKNVELVTSKVSTKTIESTYSGNMVCVLDKVSYISRALKQNYSYDADLNETFWFGKSTAIVKFVEFTATNGVISNFQTKLPFRAVDQNELNELNELNQDKATAVNYDNITNCITEIPQDIKLELNNGTLTLKAGSKVYNGNGLLATTSTDLQAAWATTGTAYISVTADQKSLYVANYLGETVSSLPNPTTSYKLYYNTTDGKCYFDEGSWREVSFPIAIISATGQISSIDQVFNGFGYIGNTMFALPGVKGLIPNGRNIDGTLKNIEFTITKVIPITINSSPNGIKSIYFTTSGGMGITSSYTYDLQKNILLDTEDNDIINGCIAINFVWDNSQQAGQKITSFNPKLPFRAVDANAFEDNFVNKTVDEEIGGVKTFNDTTYFAKNGNNIVLSGGVGGKELGEILFAGNNDYPNGTHLDRYENCLRIFGQHDQTKTHAILTNQGISKAWNGYVKLGNGLIIQWGQSGTGTDITLPTPFTSTNYKVVSTGSSYNKYGPGYSYDYTTTTFKLGGDNGNRPWIAIGY